MYVCVRVFVSFQLVPLVYCSVGRNVVEMVTYTFAFWIFEYLIAKMRSCMPRRAWALNLIYAATFALVPLLFIHISFILRCICIRCSCCFALFNWIIVDASYQLLVPRERRSLVTCFRIKSERTFIANGLHFGRSSFECLNSHDSRKSHWRVQVTNFRLSNQWKCLRMFDRKLQMENSTIFSDRKKLEFSKYVKHERNDGWYSARACNFCLFPNGERLRERTQIVRRRVRSERIGWKIWEMRESSKRVTKRGFRTSILFSSENCRKIDTILLSNEFVMNSGKPSLCIQKNVQWKKVSRKKAGNTPLTDFFKFILLYLSYKKRLSKPIWLFWHLSEFRSSVWRKPKKKIFSDLHLPCRQWTCPFDWFFF